MRRRFADGFPDLFVENAVEIRNKHVAFLASFHDPSVIFEQMSVIYALPRLFVGSFTLVLPFFPTGTLERVRWITVFVQVRRYERWLLGGHLPSDLNQCTSNGCRSRQRATSQQPSRWLALCPTCRLRVEDPRAW